MAAKRKYPVGIQTFSRLRREGYVYVDKTDMVWLLAQENNPFLFFARPRRFGKSLLASTLHSFFAGERELFRGLKADELEWDWKQYPVLHFDLSGAKHLPPQGVRDELGRQMLNVYARTQVKCHGGRIDIVVLMPQATYVFEQKMHETAQKALEQIDTKGYDTEGRRVVKCGLHFDLDSRTLDEWAIGD